MLAFAEHSWSKLRSSNSLTRQHQWPEPEQSTGTHYCRMGKNECWQAIGPAEQMNKELSKDVRKLLEERIEYIGEGEPVDFYFTFRLYMTGRRRSCARPTIMVCCERPIPRRRARELIRESGILDNYPGVIAGESSHAPDFDRPPEPLALGDQDVDACPSATDRLTAVFCQPSQDLCGLEIFIKGNGGRAPLRRATIGGILRSGGRYYALTVAHVFDNIAGRLEAPKDVDFEFDIDEQSGSDTEDESFVEATSGGSRTPDSATGGRHFAPYNDPSGNPSLCRSITGRTNYRRENDMMGSAAVRINTKMPLLISGSPGEEHDGVLDDYLQVLGLLVMSSTNGLYPSLDWGLVEITRPGLVMFNRILQSNIAKSSFIYPERFVTTGPREANVLAATSSGGVLSGKLSETATFMKFPQSRVFQEVWTVYLNGKLMKGDCGSWVVDAKSGDVYGHIIAGNPGTGVAYVIPGYQIQDDIAKQFGCGLEISTKAHFPNDGGEAPQSSMVELGIAPRTTSDRILTADNGISEASPNVVAELGIETQRDQVNPLTDEMAVSIQMNRDTISTEVTNIRSGIPYLALPSIPSRSSTVVSRTTNSPARQHGVLDVLLNPDLEDGRGLKPRVRERSSLISKFRSLLQSKAGIFSFGHVKRSPQNADSVPLLTMENLTHARFRGEDRLSLNRYVQARNKFFSLIFSQPTLAEPLSEPFIWYAAFLEGKFKSAWVSLLRPAIVGLYSTSDEPGLYDIAIIYDLMTITATTLIQTKDLALVDIVDDLLIKHCMLNGDIDDVPCQLIFAAIGWLTMQYEPVLRPGPGQLEIVDPRTHRRRSKGRFISYKQNMDSCDQPFNLLLRKFGDIMPKLDHSLSDTSELIIASSVCFHVLSKVASIKIEWVNSLSLHLEFDNIRRTLKIFRFPSFCKVMYLDSNTLSRLYMDNEQCIERREESGEDPTSFYFREVLLSYRLIFGQDKASWKAFQKASASWHPGWDWSDHQSEDGDPLLRTLCGSAYGSPEARLVYQEIDAKDEVSPYYHPDSDFPFLGRRLLNLQTFVTAQNPHGWRVLWHDRRNLAFWWAFWALLFVGGIIIVLGIVQSAFQIWRAASAIQ